MDDRIEDALNKYDAGFRPAKFGNAYNYSIRRDPSDKHERSLRAILLMALGENAVPTTYKGMVGFAEEFGYSVAYQAPKTFKEPTDSYLCIDNTQLLSLKHLEALKWFSDHHGQEVDWPGPLHDGETFLVNKAKGIQKPKGSTHALSVRTAIGEQYGDGPELRSDGTWTYRYHLELRSKREDPLSFSTNSGLLRCVEDNIPVGVILQIRKSPARYQVFGLGSVIAFESPFFIIEGPHSNATNREQNETFDPNYNPGTNIDFDPDKAEKDGRQKQRREAVQRQGQAGFRKSLMQAYNHRCAVTGCNVPQLLEAAHILPYRGIDSNHVSNGLLLRSDIHVLFDRDLLFIDPETYKIALAEVAQNDPIYATINGQTISLPEDENSRPHPEALRRRQTL